MREKLLKLLKDINPDIDYEKEDKLIDDGIFDSLEIMQVVLSIEEKFRVEIDPEMIEGRNFNSLETMLALIKQEAGK